MKLPTGQKKFTNPGIEIDVTRLRDIISAGDIAAEALSAPNLRLIVENTSAGGRIENGVLGDLLARRAQLARSGATKAIQENEAAIRREEARRHEAREGHIRAVALRDRCVAYALEAGLRLADLARFEAPQTLDAEG